MLAQVTNVTDPEFRCYELDLVNTASQTQTATVTAGSNVGFHADAVMGHPGVRVNIGISRYLCSRSLELTLGVIYISTSRRT